jgi:hypothetical protein
MKHAAILVAGLALVACGGTTRATSELAGATCCCVAGDLREVVADTVCQERGGSCDPAETCDAADPDEAGADEVDDSAY